MGELALVLLAAGLWVLNGGLRKRQLQKLWQREDKIVLRTVKQRLEDGHYAKIIHDNVLSMIKDSS